jgi:hypothetical protein
MRAFDILILILVLSGLSIPLTIIIIIQNNVIYEEFKAVLTQIDNNCKSDFELIINGYKMNQIELQFTIHVIYATEERCNTIFQSNSFIFYQNINNKNNFEVYTDTQKNDETKSTLVITIMVIILWSIKGCILLSYLYYNRADFSFRKILDSVKQNRAKHIKTKTLNKLPEQQILSTSENELSERQEMTLEEINETIIKQEQLFQAKQKLNQINQQLNDFTEINITNISTNLMLIKSYFAEHDCCICLGNLNSKTITFNINCNHLFHTMCINQWKKINLVCPTCNKPLKLIKL